MIIIIIVIKTSTNFRVRVYEVVDSGTPVQVISGQYLR